MNEWTRRHQVLFVRKRRENESVVDGEGTDGVGRMLLSWRHNGVLIGTLTRFDLLLFSLLIGSLIACLDFLQALQRAVELAGDRVWQAIA